MHAARCQRLWWADAGGARDPRRYDQCLRTASMLANSPRNLVLLFCIRHSSPSEYLSSSSPSPKLSSLLRLTPRPCRMLPAHLPPSSIIAPARVAAVGDDTAVVPTQPCGASPAPGRAAAPPPSPPQAVNVPRLPTCAGMVSTSLLLSVATRVAQLAAAGFLWTSSRQCGSAFMKSFRELRSFWEEHGHTRVGEVLGDEHELARWCETVRASRRSDKLSPKRLAYLEDIGFS